MNKWEKFNKKVDLESLKKDVKDAEQNKREFVELPEGNYIIQIEKLELVESKKGDPMLTCWMKVVDGQYKGQRLFYNQVLIHGFSIHMANEFLRSLDSDLDVKLDDYVQYGNLLLDIAEKIDGKLEYEVEYGKNDKGFNTYKIVEVFEIE